MYDTLLVQTHARLASKLLMASGAVEKRERASICLLFERADEEIADVFVSEILDDYKSLDIVKIDYSSQLQRCNSSQLLFLLNTKTQNIESVVEYAKKRSKLTMSYDSSYLKFGVILSLHIGRSVKPYINFKSANVSGVQLGNALKRVAKPWKGGWL